MASSTALASIFGPLLIITSLWTLLYKENMKKVIDSLKKTPALIYFIGVFNVLLGVIFINSFNYWYMSIEVLVTLLGWLFLIRGLLIMFFPKMLDKMIKTYTSSYIFFSLVGIAWGIALTWFAFN
ncbi:MAG: hypothetical protein KFB93_01135 [Simkaniaceae bacterium]|jgi:uncharacterized protein YjeT (DUF2065 family)|nr:MAG: hypothetical protein KFB93_01135 [Simkaniaceae bacterium]